MPALATLALATLMICPGVELQIGDHTFHRRTLKNGLEALAVDDGQGGTISVFVVYAVGNRAETAATTGLAHLTEHALFTGTATTPVGKHDAAVKALGGESNAYTRDDFTTYYAHKIPPKALKQVLSLEADRMRNLTWGEKDFLHERDRLRVEEQHSNKTDVQLGRRRAFAVWSGRGYGAGLMNAKGNSKAPGLSLATTRAFYDTWYHPRNASVVVVGADPVGALDAIDAAFSALPAGPRPPSLATPALGAGSMTIEAPLSRPRVEWVWQGPGLRESSDRLALYLLTELCEGRKSEDGSPIEVWQGGHAGPDLFVIAATGDKAQDGVQAAYEALLASEWTDEQLAKAKRHLGDAFTSKPIRSRPYFSLAVQVATLVAYGHGDVAARFADDVAALDTGDLDRVAKRWLAPTRRITITYTPTKETKEAAPLPKDTAALKKAAEEAQASGDLERAIAAYEVLLTRRPGRVNLVIYRFYLAQLNRDQGRLLKAKEHLLEGLKVVKYPALEELLEKVNEELGEKGTPPAEAETPAPASRPANVAPGAPKRADEQPASRPANPHAADPNAANPHAAPDKPEPAQTSRKHKVVGTTGEAPPEWAAQGSKVMEQLETWRGESFTKDLVVEFLEEDKDGPAGWYEPKTGRLVVTLKGTARFGQGTMLHEMFHALQDQKYDLMDVHERAPSPDANRAITSLIEGEAMLAVQELMNYDFSQHAKLSPDGALSEERFKKIFHYGEGLQFILAIRKARGWEGVTRVFLHPPMSTAEIFHPDRYLEGWRPLPPHILPPARLGPEEELIESAAAGEFGARLFLARPPETRGRRAELCVDLRGDVLHEIKDGEGNERHEWRLRFGSEASAKAFSEAAAPGLKSVPNLASPSTVNHRKGTLVTLVWVAKADEAKQE